MMNKVAFREGVGNIFAEGIVNAAKRFGPEAEKYVSHSKGMVMAGIDCRMLKGNALCFATSTRGADHLRGMPAVEFTSLLSEMRMMEPEEAERRFGTTEAMSAGSYKKASAAVYYQHESILLDILEMCRFARIAPKIVTADVLCNLYTLATGVEADEKTMEKAAERIYNVERAFGVRMGMDRKDDHLVGKWAEEPVPNGPFKGDRIDPEKFEAMLDEYYQLRGWDKNGIPTPEKLRDLGLEDVIDKIGKRPQK